MHGKKNKTQMSWGRLYLLCRFMRIYADTDTYGGCCVRLEFNMPNVTYEPLVDAGWLMRVRKPYGYYETYRLTEEGMRLMHKLMDTGLTKAHLGDALDVTFRRSTARDAIKKLFKDPARLLAGYHFRTGNLLPALNAELMQEFIPGKGTICAEE